MHILSANSPCQTATVYCIVTVEWVGWDETGDWKEGLHPVSTAEMPNMLSMTRCYRELKWLIVGLQCHTHHCLKLLDLETLSECKCVCECVIAEIVAEAHLWHLAWPREFSREIPLMTCCFPHWVTINYHRLYLSVTRSAFVWVFLTMWWREREIQRQTFDVLWVVFVFSIRSCGWIASVVTLECHSHFIQQDNLSCCAEILIGFGN